MAYMMKIDVRTEYTVCYEDRFMGLIECRVDEYLESHDIPFHRIQIFK